MPTSSWPRPGPTNWTNRVRSSTFEVQQMRINRFEDIQAWQEARALCKKVYSLSRSGRFAKDFALRDQTRRAVASIMANIAEGFDSRSNPEFIQFLYYSLRSASELQSHLYIALDQDYVTRLRFMEVYEQAGKIKGMVFRFIEYLRSHQKPRTSNLERSQVSR
ncbi:MAG: four helix bundle protein [Nitrospirales bacterium]